MEQNLQDPSAVIGTLSVRETLVLDLTSRGLTNREIAAHLEVTVHAVKFHLASVYRKLGVANRTEAARIYLLASRHSVTGAD